VVSGSNNLRGLTWMKKPVVNISPIKLFQKIGIISWIKKCNAMQLQEVYKNGL
jgi:hypothetical protein